MLRHIDSQEYGKAMCRFALPGMKGLELGPLHHPYARKAEGVDIFYVDYRSAEDLREANKDNPEIDVKDIVDLDYVWTPGKTLVECLSEANDAPAGDENGGEDEGASKAPQFDYILASQVVEHVPDTLGWIKELFGALKTGGVLVLGVPDKNYTFDAYRRESSLPEILECYVRREKFPTPRQIFDNCAYAIEDKDFTDRADMTIPFEARKHLYTPEQALNFATYAYHHREYIDSHCTVWTPENFTAIFEGINRLGLLECSVEIDDLPGCDSFVAYLTKNGVGRDLPESYEERLEKENAHLHKAYDEAVALQQELWGRLDKAGLLQESEQ